MSGFLSLYLGNFWSPLKRMSMISILPGILILQKLISYAILHFLLLTIQFSLVSKVSEYNPLDLLEDRIYQAMTSLFATPQNNFHIFLNGSLIFGGLGEAIFSSGVLDQLLETQKLDVLDIDGDMHAYNNIISQPCMACKSLGDPELLHQYSFLHSLPLKQSLKIVRDYLMAAPAKDCGLMISFRPIEGGTTASGYNSIFLESSNWGFDHKKTVVTVDMLCEKCKKKVMMLVAEIEGINSIALDPSKRLVTVIGDADPSEIIRKIRKFRKSAQFVSIGPAKEEKKDEKKCTSPCLPRFCQKCDVWYVTGEYDFKYCSIL